MSGKLDINILVAAKEEYTKQLVYLLSPEIYKILMNIFRESQSLKKKRTVSLRNFQILLKKIPEWNDILIDKHTEDIKSRIPFILDLITAIFVSHVKILACVKFNKKSKSIKVKVPNINNFLHKIIITISEQIYYNPDNILKKKEEVIIIISNIIEDSIRNQIPIDKILTEYLSGIFDKEVNTKNNSDSENEVDSSECSDESEELEESDEAEELDELNKTHESTELFKNLEDEQRDNIQESCELQQINSMTDEKITDSDDEEDTINLDDFKNIKTTRPIPISQLNNEITDSTEVKESTEVKKEEIENKHKKNKVLFADAKN